MAGRAGRGSAPPPRPGLPGRGIAGAGGRTAGEIMDLARLRIESVSWGWERGGVASGGVMGAG